MCLLFWAWALSCGPQAAPITKLPLLPLPHSFTLGVWEFLYQL